MMRARADAAERFSRLITDYFVGVLAERRACFAHRFPAVHKIENLYAGAGASDRIAKAIAATAANPAPVAKVTVEPKCAHRAPASELAAKSATPVSKLKMPNAVPRRSAGAVSATKAERRPWERPIYPPHKATPAKRPSKPGANANKRSAATRTPSPTTSTLRRPIRSDTTPAGIVMTA